jgi:hypothetical protein
MDGVVSKGQFATLVGVSPGQVSHWLRKGKIHGDAIVGVGRPYPYSRCRGPYSGSRAAWMCGGARAGREPQSRERRERGQHGGKAFSRERLSAQI